MSVIKLERRGYCYIVSGDGAFVFSAVTGIHINRNRTCVFNSEYIDTIIEALKKYGLSYSIQRNGELVINGAGNENAYNYFLQLGKSIYKLQEYIRADTQRIKKKLRTINKL